ncbi:MAG: hypothetical protein CMC99_04670 [Flavobacteriales bacterium]|nr:hypothetical protein [Flavobacteriales bacterium]
MPWRLASRATPVKAGANAACQNGRIATSLWAANCRPVAFQLKGFRLSNGAGMSTSRMDAPGSHWDVPGNNKEGY